MKIRTVEAELFHTDGRTDTHDESNSRFSQFGNVTKNVNLALILNSYIKPQLHSFIYFSLLVGTDLLFHFNFRILTS